MSNEIGVSEINKFDVNYFNSSNGRIFFNSVFGGGAHTFLINESKNTPLLLIDLRYHEFKHIHYLENGASIEFDIDDINDFIGKLEINSFYVNHIIWSENFNSVINRIVALAKKLDCNIVSYVHDFYSVCPTINLLDYKRKYCNLPDNKTCEVCLSMYATTKNVFSFPRQEVTRVHHIHLNEVSNWRSFYYQLFKASEKIIFPSKSTMQIWLKVYDEFANKADVLHHDLSYLSGVKAKDIVRNPSSSFYNVYIIGDIGDHKGRYIIHDLLKIIEYKSLNICINILGHYDDEYFANTPYLKQHGRFAHNNIVDILNNLNIDCFLMPSICPETFSYVTHEMIATGLPIISFNLGAQGDFVNAYQNGYIVNEVSAQGMYDILIKLYDEFIFKLYPSRDLANDELEKIIQDNIRLQLDNRKLSIVIDRLDHNVNNIHNVLNDKQNELNSTKDELNSVYSSKSWKITKPLRKLYNIFK